MNKFRPISVVLSPNIERDDVDLALKLLFKPGEWKRGKEIEKLEDEFKKFLGVKYAVSFNSGRSAIMAILEALNIKEGDEILVQAFTCNSLILPILAKKAKPIYVDIDETINLDPNDLLKKITKNSRAVILQHTFGWPGKIEEILEICKRYNLYLIEDCAHSLGAKYKGRYCGTFGNVGFFSFGRDKVISSVFGGMGETNDPKIAEGLKVFQEKIDFPSNFWIFQQLLHPILTKNLILPLYNFFHLGKILLFIFQKIKILSKAVSKAEKKGKLPKFFPKKLPNSLAALALNQFKKLEKFNSHRKEIAKIYETELKGKFKLPFAREKNEIEPIFLRYPILTQNPEKLLKEMAKRGIYLNDGWRKLPVVPPETDLSKMKYIWGSCPKAEKLTSQILNLPTHINISLQDIKRIIEFLK